MTLREMSMKMLNVMDYLLKHNELERALQIKEAAKLLDVAAKERGDLVDDMLEEKKRARKLNVALGKEIRKAEQLERQVYALSVYLFRARVKSGMAPEEARATVERDMDAIPGRKARDAFKRAGGHTLPERGA